jgi:hypothetical protein
MILPNDSDTIGKNVLHVFLQGFQGPYREALSALCTELLSPRLPLFVPCANAENMVGDNRDKYVPRPSSTAPEHLDMFFFVGQMMGVAMRTRNLLSLDLPSIVWKYLAGVEVDEDDLKATDFSCWSTLQFREEDGQAISADRFAELFPLCFTTCREPVYFRLSKTRMAFARSVALIALEMQVVGVKAAVRNWGRCLEPGVCVSRSLLTLSTMTISYYPALAVTDGKEVPLLEAGRSTPVTYQRREEYRRLVIKARLEESALQLGKMRYGQVGMAVRLHARHVTCLLVNQHLHDSASHVSCAWLVVRTFG